MEHKVEAHKKGLVVRDEMSILLASRYLSHTNTAGQNKQVKAQR